MAKGIVVQNKESGIRYAVHEDAWDRDSEKFVRDLKPGETVFSYVVKKASDSSGDQGAENDAADEQATGDETLVGTPTTNPPTTPTTNTKK